MQADLPDKLIFKLFRFQVGDLAQLVEHSISESREDLLWLLTLERSCVQIV